MDLLSDLIAEREFARQVGLSVEGLRGWRKRGYGPPVTKLGRAVYYRRAEVVLFLAGLRSELRASAAE